MRHQTLIPALLLAIFLAVGAKAQAQSMKTEYLNATPTPAPSSGAVTTSRSTTVAAAPAPVKQKNINDIARFLAGLPPQSDSRLVELAKAPEWIAYAGYMNQSWPRFEFVKLSQIKVWTVKELGKTRISTVFYPFSGPDYIYAAAYFPQASTYILCGLEPVGEIPSPEKLLPLASSLGWLQTSFKSLFNAGYFVTVDMGVELKAQGTLPLLCVMLARSGAVINSISVTASRAEIHFTAPAGGRERVLMYFSTDLSNGGLAKGSFLSFLKRAHPDTVYVKSASFLMHENEFSTVRNFILTQCDTIVQDDSGVPLRYFDQNRWSLKLYGMYTQPLDIFAKYYQPDLAALYAKTQAIPLTFGVGYHWHYPDTNLIVATAKSPGKSAPAPSSPPAGSRKH